MGEKKSRGFRAFKVACILLVLSLPIASAQTPPSLDEGECIFYAYTKSERHYFLIQDNASMFSTKVYIVHNCKNLEIIENGVFLASSDNDFEINVNEGYSNLTFNYENKSTSFNNLIFYPDRLEWEGQYQEIQGSNKKFIEINMAEIQINWAVAFSIVIVWVLSTYVYWQLINNYVERTFIEEVVK